MNVFLKTCIIIYSGGMLILFFSSLPAEIKFIAFFSIFPVLANIQKIDDWLFNRKFPILSIDATILNKSTRKFSKSIDEYYITFELKTKSNRRMEFQVDPYEYGLLMEGDYGKLTFKGLKFISFERY